MKIQYITELLKLSTLLKWIEANLLSIILAFVLISFFSVIKKAILKVFDKVIFSRMKNESIMTFIRSFVKVAIQIVLIFIIFGLFGIDLTSLFAIIGALSVVVGFAFKDVISNIFGGIILLVFKPFKVGDVIAYETYVGTVIKIEIFYTRISNPQNEVVIIPNGLLITNEVRNLTSQNKRRLDLIIGVGYGSDILKVKEVLEDIVANCEYVLKSDPHIIGVVNLNTSSIDFATNVYVEPSNYLVAKFYLLEQVKIRFDKEGIEIPFNQLDVHLKGEK